jgi:hypothetical protein
VATTVAPAAIRTHPVTRVDRVAAAVRVDLDPAAATKAVLAGPVGLADLTTPVALAGPVDPADLTIPVDLAAPVGLTTRVDLAAPVGLTTRVDLAALADLTTLAALVGLVDLTTPAALVDPADPGMATRSVATSMAPPGATGRPLGGLVSRRDRTGAGRFLLRAGYGAMARSTTGVTRKPPFGIPGSTHGASGCSESGFRCKEQ